MTSIQSLYTDNDANFRIFAWWAAVLVLKILAMAPLIGRWRFGKKVSADDNFSYFFQIDQLTDN